MPMFPPFGQRPGPGRMQGYRPAPPPPQNDMRAEELLRRTSFSPELSFLLAMTMKDGLSPDAAIRMLHDIEPYVSASDKEAIRSLYSARQVTENFRSSNVPPAEPARSGAPLADFSRLGRMQMLLNVLQRYAGQDASGMMQSLQRSTQMQEDFERMTRRMERLRNMNTSSPEQMFEAISCFMPPEKQGEFRNMQMMMRMMSTMGKNMKPEDLFKFMGGGGQA